MVCIGLSLWQAASAQTPIPYWNRNTQLLPWRMTPSVTRITEADLDGDGDPDILRATINDSIPVIWIDDDDDMKPGAREGDTDSDCLLIDRNRDGVFAGPHDFSIDWCDTDGDGRADIQLVANNAGTKVRNFYDWSADYMYVLDDDRDGILHYIDWNRMMMQAWEHSGHANFYKDYSGNSTFLKMHASTFRIGDLRYNWEVPFLFYDEDRDGHTDWAIRLLDSPVFRDPKDSTRNGFDREDREIDVLFTKRIDYAAVTWDLDKDNGPGNEFDYDMSLLFKGKGFRYDDQPHVFRNWRGLPQSDSLLFDNRWRRLDKLFYPDRDTAYPLIFRKGEWKECRLVFDEDDDCNRWERVEFYDPRDPFIIGTEKGGLDHNKQADAAGDRGEFDMDNSGRGQLYVGAFDGRIHLYGAEWGAWRIDQLAYSFQGFGGNYERWGRERLQREPSAFATVHYADSDGNGFIDAIRYDLDGDKKYEDSVSLKALGIEDRQPLYTTASKGYADHRNLFRRVSEEMWRKAQTALKVAQQEGLDTYWYNFYQRPMSMHQRYEYGYWLGFYLYQDLRHRARMQGDAGRVRDIERAYYAGHWEWLLTTGKPTGKK
ncbi:MAG: hypothetical protein EBZ67_01725 [Chitinophagia bacterium]|nr:hypothetical protein [Chitinophagia bacterium]